MDRFDVAIIGAGSAGSLAAAMLGRAGYRTCLVDPIQKPLPEFRCEKLEAAHIGALRRAGFLDRVTPSGERYDTIWIARQGHLVERRPRLEYGIDYSALVTTIRALVPETVERIQEKVTAIQPAATGSGITLANGDHLTARLTVLATGLNASLFADLGMERVVVSPNHSISAGFDVVPVGRDRFDFDALTYFGEHPDHKVSYITFFPMDGHVRVNLFVYRDKGDPWLARLRESPEAAIHEVLPRLHKLTGDFKVLNTPKLRPADLVNTAHHDKDGIVLIGDAWSTACPVSGTGAAKALVDAERLCNVYAPAWLASDKITAETIGAFYSDPEKVASDEHSRELSLFAKRIAMEPGLAWNAYRWLRFAGSLGRSAAVSLSHLRPHLHARSAS